MGYNLTSAHHSQKTQPESMQINPTLARVLKVLPLTAAMAVSACAPKDWDSEYDGAYDPLEGLNRKTYAVNKAADKVLLKPAARAYVLLPAAGRAAVGRVLQNLLEPASAANNLLQIKPDGFANSVARFAVNSSFGILGVFDAASKMGIEPAREDFGQTLRHHGWETPPYFVIPLIGPSSLADFPGRVVDAFAHPAAYSTDAFAYGVAGVGAVHVRSELLDAVDIAEEAALDEYAFVRDLYEDERAKKAKE